MANKTETIERHMKFERIKDDALKVMGYAFLFSLFMVLGLIALIALAGFFL